MLELSTVYDQFHCCPGPSPLTHSLTLENVRQSPASIALHRSVCYSVFLSNLHRSEIHSTTRLLSCWKFSEQRIITAQNHDEKSSTSSSVSLSRRARERFHIHAVKTFSPPARPSQKRGVPSLFKERCNLIHIPWKRHYMHRKRLQRIISGQHDSAANSFSWNESWIFFWKSLRAPTTSAIPTMADSNLALRILPRMAKRHAENTYSVFQNQPTCGDQAVISTPWPK